MEAVLEAIEQETEVKKLYWNDTQAERRMIAGAESCARELNNVWPHCVANNYKSLSEIPGERGGVEVWKLKRLLEIDKKLAELAQVHKIETLKYTFPAWLEEQARAFSQWHAVKGGVTQYLQYCAISGGSWVVDREALEQLFETSTAYRRYLNAEQIKRLNTCKKYIEVLKEAGMLSISTFTIPGGRVLSSPLLRIVEEKFYPCLEYVLDGTKLPATVPMHISQKQDNIIYSVFQ